MTVNQSRQMQCGWDLGFGIWDLGFGIWDLGFGIWDLGFDPFYKTACGLALPESIGHLNIVESRLRSAKPPAVLNSPPGDFPKSRGDLIICF